MITWLLIFIALGVAIGLVAKGKEGAAKGALGGFASFMVIATTIVLPVVMMLLFIRACF